MDPFKSSGTDFDEAQHRQYPSQNGAGVGEHRDFAPRDASNGSKTSLNATTATANTSSASLVDPLLLRRSAKAIAPIQVFPAPGSGAGGGLRSPAMRSSTLTDSFPLPPPRTPLTPSTSQGSQGLLESPRVHLSVPPPSPFASRPESGQSGYWDADLSSLRDQAGHPGFIATAQSSPTGTPGATQSYIAQPQKGDRIRSYIAEVASVSPHSSSSGPVTYPPTAYSPDPAHRTLPKSSLGSPAPIGATSLPGSPAAEPREYFSRPGSAGTFASALSSMHSMGMSGAINTLEHEGFDFHSDRSPSLSSHAHAFSDAASITSSIGKTHHLVVMPSVRHGNVLEARRANGQGTEASRRLARASLVSPQLFRSVGSTDALMDVLRTSPAPTQPNTPDPEAALRPPARPRMSTRYSSGPAPSLASLAEDLPYNSEVNDDEGVFVSPKRTSTRPKPTSRHSSGWTSRSPHSRKSRQSRDTHFTIASEVPSVPSIGNHAKRAELAMRDSKMSTRKMAKRASRLSQILAEKPSQGRYVSSFPAPTSETGAQPSLNELRFGNARTSKAGHGIPGIWASNYSGIVGNESGEFSSASGHQRTQSDPSIDESQFRRRRSYPVNNLPNHRNGHGPSPLVEKRERSSFSSGGSATRSHETFLAGLTSSKKRRLLTLLLLLVVLIIVVGVVGGVLLRKKSSDPAGNGCSRSCLNGGTLVKDGDTCGCRCAGSFVGSFCQLDATCQCPDGTAQCTSMLAKSIVSAAGCSNTLFTPLINTTRLASSLASYSQAGTDCTKQAQLLDLSNMDAGRYRSRQKWTQATLLWDMATSEDFDNTSLRDFQSKLDYWRWQDKASFDAQPTYQTLAHGYTIDFAFQKIFAPQKQIADVGIPATQVARLDPNSTTAFERILAYASAASVQRTSALGHLFGEMGYSADQLAAFKRSIEAAPVFLPFDATGQTSGRSTMDIAVQAQAAGQTFPRPLACAEGFSGTTLDAVNRIENGIFGLDILSEGMPANCSEAVRPIYGFLNILNLRSPVTGGPAGNRAGQAVVLTNTDIKRRMSLRSGYSLGSLPANPAAMNVSRLTTDTFGTFEQLDAVLFNYLTQLASLDLAKLAVDFILQASSGPPDASSPLLASLATLPPLEVQLWVRLPFSDIDYIVSDIGVDGREPIFGRSPGAALRSWAHSSASSKPIHWAASADSATFAVDEGGDVGFQQIWDASAGSSEQDIINTLQGAGFITQT